MSCTVILNDEYNQVVVNVTGLVRKVCVGEGWGVQLPLEAEEIHPLQQPCLTSPTPWAIIHVHMFKLAMTYHTQFVINSTLPSHSETSR